MPPARFPDNSTGVEFWIDVGGTFTDCFARFADGEISRHKLLSSGVTKGVIGPGSSGDVLVDDARRGDPAGFWEGYSLRLLDDAGNVTVESSVLEFDPKDGALRADFPADTRPAVGQSYELFSDEDAPLIAIRYLLGKQKHDALPALSVRLGTTRGTNALLTRSGAKTALVTTRGLADVLSIGYQDRPHLFRLDIKKPQPLFAETLEIDERLSADGETLHPVDPDVLAKDLEAVKSRGITSLAICLLHGGVHPKHERQLAAIADQVRFAQISVSNEVASLVGMVPRGDTTVVDAYLTPVLRDYVTRMSSTLSGSSLRMMTSAGGLVDAGRFAGKDSILSGPAGGVVGFSKVARAAGFERAIGFDMGGTSTDVSRFDGQYEMEFETEKAGVRIVAPMMAIETVAAGGGSICHFDGVRLVVGPQSAGADPGPACYGRGGPLAVTDVNFFLGKIPPAQFPFPLDRRAVESRLDALRQEIAAKTGHPYSSVELCDGYLRVANANMVKAIRSISIAKGVDPREYALVPFGGAAGQHACAVANELGITSVLLHPDAGLLSALGIGLADVTQYEVSGIYRRYDSEARAGVDETFAELETAARGKVHEQGVAEQHITANRSLDLRYEGVDAYLNVAEPSDGDYVAAFREAHQQLYGYIHKDRPLEIVAARVEAVGRMPEAELPELPRAKGLPTPHSTRSTWFAAEEYETNVYDRTTLRTGHLIAGPAVVFEANSTTIVDPGWQAEVLPRGELLLTRTSEAPPVTAQTTDGAVEQADPVMLEIFNNQFAGIAEQMGITLRNTSSSVNVKQRLDFSCALFTAEGDLVVNAPHIPVHLGAMSECVKCILEDNKRIEPGDVFVTNDPFRGGSHLPDVTVVTPVFDEAEKRLLFFTASRAHHAEIGGVRPGSMPPFSKTLAEEGVLIRNFRLLAAGESRVEQLRSLLQEAPYPTRNVEDNLADIAAQVAANRLGIEGLRRMVGRYGLPMVQSYMRFIQQAAEQKMRQSLARLPDGKYRRTDHLDDGSAIAVEITVAGERATIDFTGSADVHAGNLNANRAIVSAAVLYCLRCLIDEDIPLNQGVLAPVDLIIPPGLLDPVVDADAAELPAVAGGNVETSQRVVDVLLGALEVAAASQGTMNNLLFGDAGFGYYETICGGVGATPNARGADAVHTHMTNTRLTDAEVLETRYPVRLVRFAVRRGSGGDGKHRGGDGVARTIEFLRPLDVSILSQRRGAYAPFGLSGGEPGQLGRNILIRQADGEVVERAGIDHFSVEAGDRLTIETPGGGGWGAIDGDS